MGNLILGYARICMVVTLILKNLLGYYQDNFTGTWIYELHESEETTENPYQGIYVQMSERSPERLRGMSGYMVLLAYDLRQEAGSSQISDEKIDGLDRFLEAAEEAHISVIFRAAYDFDGKYEDPPFSAILGHIRQMGRVLSAHTDCLAGVQAGMIGPYGEWHQSSYMQGDSRYRIQVLQAWEEALPPQIPLSVRRQAFIREARQAGMDTGRIGIYNDGLFSSGTDLGTYGGDYDREQDLQWSEENLKVPFNGGEMPYISGFTDIENVVKEASQLNLSYLNRDYDLKVWEFWKTQTYEGMPADEYLKKHLGVRLWASKLEISKNYLYRRKIAVSMELCNDGFAMMDPGCRAYLAIRYNGHLVQQEAELTVHSKESLTVSGSLDDPYYDGAPHQVSIGVKLCREDGTEDYCIQLANQENYYEAGNNWLLRSSVD